MFSNEESDFIFDKIIGEFELEKELVKNALAIITKNSKTSSDKKTRTKNQKKALIGEESIWMKNWKQQSKHGSKNTEKMRRNTKTFSMLRQSKTQNH